MMPHDIRNNDPLPGSVVDGKYILEHKLGEGGMSLVYRATHVVLNRPVAFKVLRVEDDPTGECAERLAREARTLARLESPHIVEVLDCGTLDSGEPYLVLEHLTGETLAARLGRVGPLELRSACEYVIQVIDGLAEAHAKGIVHRDLKPENLFVTTTPAGDDRVKLLDFGISKEVGVTERSGAWKRLTRPYVSVGSPQYMAPEQVLCGAVDTRADVWALGVVLYELCTGELPFDGVSLAEVCARIVQATPEAPSQHRRDLPKAFDALVLKCLAKSPALRPQHVLEVAVEIRALLRNLQSRQATTLQVRRPKPMRTRRWLIAACMLAALGATLANAGWRSHSDPAHSAPTKSSLLNWPHSTVAEPALPRPRSTPAPRVLETAPTSHAASFPEPPATATQRRAEPPPANAHRTPSSRPSRPRRPAPTGPRVMALERDAGAAPPSAAALTLPTATELPEFGGRS